MLSAIQNDKLIPQERVDAMVTVGQSIEVMDGATKRTLTVREIATCPFGTTLPPGFVDVTTDRDQKNGIRVGVK